MNYTEKYHLPQWKETDRILMKDFNQMCADMEAGLSKTAADASAETARAQADAASALEAVRAAAARAQKSAENAQAAAAAAQAAADAAFRPDYMPFVIGSYTGSGMTSGSTKVTLGFRPRFVIISSQTLSNAEEVRHVFITGDRPQMNEPITIDDDGFTVYAPSNMNSPFPLLNDTKSYYYIAFR